MPFHPALIRKLPGLEVQKLGQMTKRYLSYQTFKVHKITICIFPFLFSSLAPWVLTLIKCPSSPKDYMIQILIFSHVSILQHSITITNVKIATVIILFLKICTCDWLISGYFFDFFLYILGYLGILFKNI